MGASISLMDRLNRAGVDRLVGVLERLAATGALERLELLADRLGAALDIPERVIGALDAANREMSAKPAAAGGLGGLWGLMRERENQETLRFLLAVGRGIRGGKTPR
jgi:uncharacterized protein YjgD (DUF1641 family)